MQGYERQRTPQMGMGQIPMQRGTPTMGSHMPPQQMKQRNPHAMMQQSGGRNTTRSNNGVVVEV